MLQQLRAEEWQRGGQRRSSGQDCFRRWLAGRVRRAAGVATDITKRRTDRVRPLARASFGIDDDDTASCLCIVFLLPKLRTTHPTMRLWIAFLLAVLGAVQVRAGMLSDSSLYYCKCE